MFCGCTVPPDSDEIELGSSDWKASLSASKNNGIVLVACRPWKYVPTAISGAVDIFVVPGCHVLRQMSSQWGLQKLCQGLVSHELTAYLSVFDLFLIQWTMVILSKGCKPNNFEQHNSLKPNFTNIWGLPFNLCWMWIFLWVKFSWHSYSIWDKLEWHKWFWQFLNEWLSSFNLKGFYYSYTWSCSLCGRRNSFFTGLISRKLCGFLLMFSTDFTSLGVFFSSIDHVIRRYA